MADLTLFVCALDELTLETYGQVVDDRAEPGRAEGHCEHCGTWLALDDEAHAYDQACGYCGRGIWGGEHG